MMMNKKQIFKKVGGIISELNEQFEYFSQNPDNLNELELKLFAANANFLSEHISILLKLNASSGEIIKDNIVSEIKEEEIIPVAPVNIELMEEEVYVDDVEELSKPDWKFSIENESVVSFDFEDKNPDELFDRPLTEEELRVINDKTQLKIIPEPESDIHWDNRQELENLPPVISEEPAEVVQVDTTEFEPVSLV